MENEGLRTGVLFPDTGFGTHAAEAFSGVEKRGGTVVVSVGYSPEATTSGPTPSGSAERTTRPAPRVRQAEEEAEEKGMDPSKVVLPPSVELDGIYPGQLETSDSWQCARIRGAIGLPPPPARSTSPCSASMPGTTRDCRDGGDYGQKSVFDASRPASRPGVEDFVQSHSSVLKRPPGVLDAPGFHPPIGEAVLMAGPDRMAVRTELSEVKLTAPVAGGGHFGENREVAFSCSPRRLDCE